jgi:hypothetical protein|tara:strand:- start:191 stop:544 length:354 start_codon:yes stop_codon:yes gene_type:complete
MYYFLEGLDYKWTLVLETPSSQKFIVEIDGKEELKATFDIHYTRPKIAYVSVCLIGNKLCVTDGLFHWLFLDLEKIIKRHGHYDVIDYSLVQSENMFNGNYGFINNNRQNGQNNLLF